MYRITTIVLYFMTLHFLIHLTSAELFIPNDLNHSFVSDIHQIAWRYLNIVKPVSYINFIVDRQTTTPMCNTIINAHKLHSVILNNPSEKCAVSYDSTNSYMKIHYIVGIYKTPKHVEPYQWQIMYGNNWNSRAFIAIWITDPTTSTEDIQQLLAKFWIYNSFNIIVIAYNPIENTTNVYSYDPFYLKNDDINSRGEIFQIPKNGSLFPDKIKNLQGYQIPISFYNDHPHTRVKHFNHMSNGGMDINYSKFLAHWMNFTIILKTANMTFSNYNLVLPNNTHMGIIGEILTNRSDFIGNSIYWEIQEYPDVDVIYPRWRSEIIVAVPRAIPIPGIFHLFASDSGLTLIPTAVALTILLIFFKIRGDTSPFLRILTVLLHQNFGKIGKKASERLFAIAWIYWSFILVSIFQSQLIHDLTAPPFYNNIDSLVELDRSNLTLLARRWQYIAVNNSYVMHKRELIKHSVIESNLSKCRHWLLQYRNVACAFDKSFADYTTSKIARAIYKRDMGKNSKATWQIHFIEQPLIKYWKTYAVRKSFPYLDKINEVTSRIVEMGIMGKWMSDDISNNFELPSTTNKFDDLTLDNMDKVFMILIYGHAFATIVFMCEIIFYKFKCKSNARFIGITNTG